MTLYLRYAAIHLRSQLQYPASFIMTSLGQFFSAFAGFAAIWFLMDRFATVEGFTLPQVLLCYAVVTMAFAVSECFFRGLDGFQAILANGQFDRILLRPRNTVFQVIAQRMEFNRIGAVVQAAAVLAYALATVDLLWTWDRVLALILMIVCGVVMFSALFLLFASLCFFTTEGLEVMNILTYGSREFGKYPYSVYGKGVLRFLTFVIPLALFQYYPLLYLIGASQNRLYMLLPLLGCLFPLPCYGVWRLGLRQFKSTGS